MPLNLITTIQADATLNAAFLAEDDATLLAGLNARTVQQPVAVASPRDLLTGLGTDLADTLLGIMESTNNVTKAFKQRMIQSGLEFDDIVTQAMLQTLQRHPQWPADATAKLHGLSVKVMSPVERDHGDGVTAVQEDVTFTRDTWIREGVASWARNETDRVINEHVTGGARDVTTRAGFKAAMRE